MPSEIKMCFYYLQQVYSTDVQYFKTIEGRTATKIGMKLHLQSIHFGGGPVMNGGGQLILRCTAQIGNLYQEYTEKELGVPQKDPIPARGKFSNLSSSPEKLIKTFLSCSNSYLVNCHRYKSISSFYASYNLRHLDTPAFEIVN